MKEDFLETITKEQLLKIPFKYLMWRTIHDHYENGYKIIYMNTKFGKLYMKCKCVEDEEYTYEQPCERWFEDKE